MKILQQHYPDIQTLRDVTEEQLRLCQSEMPEEIFRRCLHVVTEDERVLAAAGALRSGDFHKFGRIIHDAHISMRDNYAASCVKTDLWWN